MMRTSLTLILSLFAILLVIPAYGADLAPAECTGPDDPFCQNPLNPTNRIDAGAACEECLFENPSWTCREITDENETGRTECDLAKDGESCVDRGAFCEIIFVQP